jgi:hypothetical protein
MSTARRFVFVLAVGVLGSAVFGGGTALAAYIGYTGSFTGAGSSHGAFVKPTSIDVNDQTGDILVLDRGKANPIMQFDSSGAPKAFSALAGDNTIGPIAVAPGFGGERTTDLAVDNSGTATQGRIYVVSNGPAMLYAFESDGTPVGAPFPLDLSGMEGYGSCGVAPDAQGNIWISDGATAVEYSPAGVATGATQESPNYCRGRWDTEGAYYGTNPFGGAAKFGSLTSGPGYNLNGVPAARDLTVDPATNDVYVVNGGSEVARINKRGLTLSRFGTPDPDRGFDGLGNSEGVGFNPTTGDVYASDIGTSRPRIDIFNYVSELAPVLNGEVARNIRSGGVEIGATVIARDGNTTVAVEYGTTAAYGSVVQGPTLIQGYTPTKIAVPVEGLAPRTNYHYRVVVTNPAGSVASPDHTFSTFTFPPGGADPCPNALARQQTGAAGLLDCRAYEQVSALDTSNYDVESNQIPNGAPLSGFPEATDPPRVAYTLSSGSIPGTDNPTGYLGDPYIATRTDAGWTTQYVGLPADRTNDGQPFSSPLLGASGSLGSLAFGGPGFCAVCLPDGSKGIPVRTPSGHLIQGMAGSLNPSGALPAGFIGKHFSADGAHFLFGSTSQFEPDGGSNGTDVSIYDHNLSTGETHVVSKAPAGGTMTGAGIAALDISRDGSRILVARKVSTDGKGNDYWHLYMNVGDAGQTIDLTPGAAAGALYDGMTADGSKVFFASVDQLTADDHDMSADIYRADVSAAGAILTRVSVGSGGTGDTNSCDPVSDSAHARWNSLGTAANCDAVAIGGGGGVGAGDGTIYFLSPELLAGPGSGVVDAPNLYVSRGGAAPEFVATLESSLNPDAKPQLQRLPVSSFDTKAGALGLTVDPSSGDIYVMNNGTGEFDGSASVERFDAAGNPSNFTSSAPYITDNKLTTTPNGMFRFAGFGQMAVDDSSGPTSGDIYIGGAFFGFQTGVFKPSGEFVDYVPNAACGVMFGDAGDLYTMEGGSVNRYLTVDDQPINNMATGVLANFGFNACAGGAVDSSGSVYLANLGSFARKFSTSQFSASAGKSSREYKAKSSAIAIDRATGDLYIDEKTQISQYNSAGELVVAGIGAGTLTDSRGVWFANDTLYASDFASGKVWRFGPAEPVSSAVESNPLVVHAVDSPGVRRTADFEVVAGGGIAVFPSHLPLTGAPSGQRTAIYRFDPSGGGRTDCVSCSPTGSATASDAALPENGLGLSDDGRVFFTTAEPLVLRDAAGRKDVYEWSNGDVQLISTGKSLFDATLLTAGADGTDVHFFSREDLLSTGTGQAMKIFDARSGGGRFLLPPPARCAASDECHGPGTQPAPPQGIGTIAGKGGQHKQPKSCKKGKVRKHGKCVAKKKQKKQQAKKSRANSTRRNG